MTSRPRRPSLRPLLSGGDRRSLAGSKHALTLIRAHPELVAEVAALTGDGDWLVSLRALDLLEKIAHEHPDRVEPYRGVFIGPLAESDKWELHLQIVRALPLLQWTPGERARALAILRRELEHPRPFVKAWALDSLARFARDDTTLVPVVRRYVDRFARSGSGALAARARRIRLLLPPRTAKGDRVPGPAREGRGASVPRARPRRPSRRPR